jgi:hypothetical protein
MEKIMAIHIGDLRTIYLLLDKCPPNNEVLFILS